MITTYRFMKITKYWPVYFLCLLLLGCKTEPPPANNNPRPIEILFLGHESEHHHSEAFMPMLATPLFKEGINFTYTEDPASLNPETLSHYDGLLLYANHETITSAQEEALLDFVESGKGFVPVHCASYCFRNSQKYINLVGGQFLKHDTGTFVANILQPDHPAMEGVKEFSVWDETYVHHKLTDNRTVLMERTEGESHEPWTWTREQGQGRVFYTAYGHDERLWRHPEFHQLIKQGILWAVGDQVQQQWQAYVPDIPELKYVARDSIPNYEQRNPPPKYQLPLSPSASRKLIQVPPEFTLELFASEPDIINPIAINWDERGRLWVIETVDYPNTVRDTSGVGDDRIKICEDTDGDGKADKFTVFADQLNIPTSLTFAHGGVIVSQAPNFLFLKDTDGDDRADERKILVKGWGTSDTHAGPSNLTYGIDNWLWGVVGYSGFEGTIGKKDYQFNQVVYRLRPDASDFEVMTHTSNNTWGLGFTEDFEVFASTANNTHSVYLGIPDAYYENVDGLPTNGSTKIDGHYAMQPLTPNVRQVDVWGGFTAAAGHHFYAARNFPEAYWNRIAFVCEPTGGVVHQAIIEKEGAGFVEKNGGNLLASADEWVSPVAAQVGPDGAVWVADWYNFIVQHNPTPTPDRGGYEAQTGEGNAYVNPLRDRQHGRIWRIVDKDAEPHASPALSSEDPKGLVAALGNDNMFWRLTAQRLLVERGETDVLPELYQLVKKRKADALGLNNAALHALWTLHGLGALDGANDEAYRVATEALHHPAAGVRKAAIQVLPRTPWANQAILKSQVVDDPDPHTRRVAALALADMPASAGLGARLYTLSQQDAVQQDAWLAKATFLAGSRHKDGFMAAYLAAHPQYEALRAQQAALPARQEAGYPDFEGTTVADALMDNYWNKPDQEKTPPVAVTSEEETQVIEIKTVKNAMQYDISEFTVEAGKPVKIVFENPDFMQHNLIIAQVGSLETVGAAADKLATDPQGAEQGYVPRIPEVLFSTPLADPQQTLELTFVAPDTPGEYPFVCTFPGHWRIMQGTMKVVSAENI